MVSRDRHEPVNLLQLVADMTRAFTASLNVDETLRHGLGRIVDYLDAEAGSLFLQTGENSLICNACFGPVDITGLTLPIDQGIVGRTVRANLTSRIRDVSKDPDFHMAVDADTGFTTRSILCAPLSVNGQCFGAIELINKTTGSGLFTGRDEAVLEALTAAAALAIDNARLAKQLVEQERLKRELELAAEIQRGLLPTPAPAPFPIAGVNRPARGVSGDFFDIITLAEDTIFFNLGDVSGKGIDSALLMAKTTSLFRSLCKTIRDPGQLLARINAELCETQQHGRFVTMIGGVYDPTRGTVRLANAGHEPAILYRADGITLLNADVPPLGIFDDVHPGDAFPEVEVALDDSALYIYSDGLTEAETADGGMVGVDGIAAAVDASHHLPLADRAHSLADLAGVAGSPLRDDVTVLVIDGRLRPSADMVAPVPTAAVSRLGHCVETG